MRSVLVVVDCCRRFDGGGDTSLPFELGRFPNVGLSAMLDARSRYMLLDTSGCLVDGDCRSWVPEADPGS